MLELLWVPFAAATIGLFVLFLWAVERDHWRLAKAVMWVEGCLPLLLFLIIFSYYPSLFVPLPFSRLHLLGFLAFCVLYYLTLVTEIGLYHGL